MSVTRWLRRLLIALLALIALYAAYRYTLHRLVEAKLDAIRREGYPVTLAELDKWYPQPPPGENAADVYLEAFKHLAPKQDSDTNLPVVGYAKLPARGESLPEETRAAIAEYLKRNEQALPLLHEAATKVDCRYPLDFSKGIAIRLPHLAKVRQSARLLYLETILHVERGEPEFAAQSLTTSARLPRSLMSEPLVISHAVLVACERIACMDLERALNAMVFTDEQLVALSVVFTGMHSLQTLSRALAGERCVINAWFSIPNPVTQWDILKTIYDENGSVDSPLPLSRPAFVLYQIAGLLTLDQLAFLEATEENVAATSKPFPERLRALQIFETEWMKLYGHRVFACEMLGGTSLFILHDARAAATQRTATTAIALERFRIAERTLPNALDELVPKYLNAVPQDPFDGKPLRYKKLAKGYVVYSIGEDKVDDGGDEKKDITFTVER
jgi:hypothetical protein